MSHPSTTDMIGFARTERGDGMRIKGICKSCRNSSLYYGNGKTATGAWCSARFGRRLKKFPKECDFYEEVTE